MSGGFLYDVRTNIIENDVEPMYSQINNVTSQNKKILSCSKHCCIQFCLFYRTIKIFSIENGKLNSNTKLIKTSGGIKNELGYELEFTVSSNRENPSVLSFFNTLDIQYNSKNKIINIPLILDDSKITDKRIRYQFKGKYFEKL